MFSIKSRTVETLGTGYEGGGFVGGGSLRSMYIVGIGSDCGSSGGRTTR